MNNQQSKQVLDSVQALYHRHFQVGPQPEEMIRGMLETLSFSALTDNESIGQHTIDYFRLSSFFEELLEIMMQDVENELIEQ